MPNINLTDRLRAELERLSRIAPRLELFGGGGGRGPVLVAVSGGPDSVALLHLAHGLGLELAVAHLDHGLRNGSADDATFVRDLCANLGVPVHLERADVAALAEQRGWGLEEAARTLRYAFLTRTAQKLGASAILTAHTLDDQAETVVLQLLRGTARATGIPPRRDRILRPLLGTRRAELRAYLTERSLTWRDDETNQDARFNRNWVRLEVLPMLETRFGAARLALARYAQLSRDEDGLLEELTDLVPGWASWRDQAVPVQRRLIRRLLEAARIRTDLAHIESLREALSASAVTRVSLPEDHTGLVQNGRVYVMDARHEFVSSRPPEVALQPLEMPADLDFGAFPRAVLRHWKPGDRIRLAGGTRKLVDVFGDRRLPREWRERVPVVAQDAEVLWVGLDPPLTDVRIGLLYDAEFEAMGEALRLAREAASAGEVPVGAVVVRGTGQETQIVGRGMNRSRAIGDMTRHAELEAIREATRQLGTPYLTDCTLIVTLEPCAMCLGAVFESRLPRIVFGATNDRSGALGGVPGSLRAPWLALHRPIVRPGVRANECSALLTAFFEGVRQNRESNQGSGSHDSTLEPDSA